MRVIAQVYSFNTDGLLPQVSAKYSDPSSDSVRLSVANIIQNAQCQIFWYVNFGIPHFLHKIVTSLDRLRFKISYVTLLFIMYCLQLFFLTQGGCAN